MLLDNIVFDFPTSIATIKNEFIVAFSSDTQKLFDKQLKQEMLKGFSIAPLYIINYWAAFILCMIIKHEASIINDVSYDTYNTTYGLDDISLNLQKINIDISKIYAIFDLFGYSN